VPAADPAPVSVRDLEVADRIARAVRGGKAADRHPTIEQVVAAFGEQEATPDARRRAARALALAGVATVPDLLEAAPGQRILLEVRTGRRRRPLLLAILALAALIGAAAALASSVDLGNDTTGDFPSDASNTTAASSSPSPTTSTAASTPPPTTSTNAPAATTTAKPQPTAAQKRKAARARARRAREKRARERRAKARAAARARVTVRLVASQPTFLCVDGDGRRLFDGTLSGSRTFRAKVVRMNVGLGPSTRVTANGKAVPLTASPTGVQVTPKGQTFLPLGARPCA
jgi:cytoskeletal protein RodZ